MKTIPTVHELRKAGFKVKLQHHRRFFKYDQFTGKKNTVTIPWSLKESDFNDFYLDAKGGETKIVIYKEAGHTLFEASVLCSKDDSFCKKSGAKKAIASALHGSTIIQ